MNNNKQNLLLIRALLSELGVPDVDDQIEEFIRNYNVRAAGLNNKLAEASWKQSTNITDVNEREEIRLSMLVSQFNKEAYLNASKYDTADVRPELRRQLDKVKDIGASALRNETKLERLHTVVSEMSSIYSKAQPCLIDGKCYQIEPGLTDIMSNSQDYDLLLSAWKGWREQTGPKLKDLFTEYVSLANEGVQELGYADYGDSWRSKYKEKGDDYDFQGDLMRLFEQIKPLYEQLHAYVRRRLKSKFHKDHPFPSSGHIPAHLLGNMWSQQWDHIYDDLIPFKNKQPVDITQEMLKKNYTVRRIFETAEDFYMSIGMPAMTQTFWEKSMIEKPSDGRDVTCHGSASDFNKDGDYRIKMCTVINHEDFNTVHHEMGHIEYYMMYAHQPFLYREGANPGFHEAVGDFISLSVQTPEHLRKVGLLDSDENDRETDLNFLMSMALQKVAFLPFGYMIDQWRWRVFSGDIPVEEYNSAWWDLRCRLQGISSPIPRDSHDFDPGAKYHVIADVPYIRYFVSFIIQFQFHEAACRISGHTGPLQHCDIYNSKAAGEAVMDMLRLGSSKPWPQAMEQLTGSRQINASSLLEYFRPLYEFLKEENGDDFGWDENCPGKDTNHEIRVEGEGDPLSIPIVGRI